MAAPGRRGRRARPRAAVDGRVRGDRARGRRRIRRGAGRHREPRWTLDPRHDRARARAPAGSRTRGSSGRPVTPPGCPSTPRASGWSILREFGRWLRERFRVLVLAGASQSAWCVNTFVGEGFNEDPGSGTGVYDGAFAYLSGGNWLAVNRWGDDGAPQAPVRPARRRPRAGGRPAHPARERPVPGGDLQLHRLLPPAGQPIGRRPAPGARAGTTTSRAPTRRARCVPRRRGVRDARLQRRPGGADEPDRRRAGGPGHAARVVPGGRARPRLPDEVPALPPSVFFTSCPRRRRASTSTGSRVSSCGCPWSTPTRSPSAVSASPTSSFRSAGRSRSRCHRAAQRRSTTCAATSEVGSRSRPTSCAPATARPTSTRRRYAPGVRRAGGRRVRVGVGAGAGGRRRPPRLRRRAQPACAEPVAHPLDAVGLAHLASPNRPAARSTRARSGIMPSTSTVTNSVGRSGTRVSPSGSMKTGSEGSAIA